MQIIDDWLNYRGPEYFLAPGRTVYEIGHLDATALLAANPQAQPYFEASGMNPVNFVRALVSQIAQNPSGNATTSDAPLGVPVWGWLAGAALAALALLGGRR